MWHFVNSGGETFVDDILQCLDRWSFFWINCNSKVQFGSIKMLLQWKCVNATIKTKQLLTKEKTIILGLHKVKVHSISIVRQLDVSKTIVYTILKNFQVQRIL